LFELLFLRTAPLTMEIAGFSEAKIKRVLAGIIAGADLASLRLGSVRKALEEKLALEEGALEEEADAVKQLVATIVVSLFFLHPSPY
jgi:hypothetical protein